MVISDNGASAEGGPTGTTNEAQFFNNAPEPLEDSLAAHRRDRRPDALQPLPVGLDLGRQHAVPAVEAGDLPRRRRATRSSSHWPAGHHGQGRGPHPVRAHHRHGADRARRCSASSRPPTIRGVTQSPIARASASRTPSTTPTRREPAPHAVLRDARPPRDLPRRLAGGLPVARARRSPRPASAFGQPISAETLSELDANGWELYHVAEDFAENHDVAAEQPRQADRADRAPGTSRPASTTCCPSTAAAWPAWSPRSRWSPLPRDSYTYCPDTQSVPFFAGAAGAQPPAQHHRRRRDPRGRRRGRAAVPGHRRRRLLASSSRTAGCTTSTTTSAAALYRRLDSETAVPAGTHELRFEFEPTGEAGHAARQGRARAAAALRRRHPGRRTPRRRSPPRSCSTRRAHLRRQPRLAGDPGLPGPFRFTGTLHSVDRRLSRRADQRQRERDAHGDGPAVAVPIGRGP